MCLGGVCLISKPNNQSTTHSAIYIMANHDWYVRSSIRVHNVALYSFTSPDLQIRIYH